jgi:hypothetical protein
MINIKFLLETINFKLFKINLKYLYQASYITFYPEAYSSWNFKMKFDYIMNSITNKIRIIQILKAL